MIRVVVVALALALLAAPLTAGAQAADKIHRIGFLGLEPTPSLVGAFLEGLRELGYVEGRNILIEWRYSVNPARYPEFAAEMLRLKVDLVVAAGPTTDAARDVIKTIPIVFVGISDPVRAGLVASLAHPGGNITGVPYLARDLRPKRLQLLKEAVPQLKRAGVLVDLTSGFPTGAVEEAQGRGAHAGR